MNFKLVALSITFILGNAFAMDNDLSQEQLAYMLTYGLEQAPARVRGADPLEKLSFKKRVQWLLDHGADINCCSPDGKYSPLSKAVARRNLKQCKILHSFGASINNSVAQLPPLNAALEYCIRCATKEDKKMEKIIFWLLENGADVNSPNDSQRLSPLKLALSSPLGRSKFVPLLIEKGAGFFIADEKGINVLMYAISKTECWRLNFIECKVLTILKYLVEMRARLISFLCIVNRLRKSVTVYERTLGSVLFLNRAKIIAAFEAMVPSLRNALSMRDQENQTAYDWACRIVREKDKKHLDWSYFQDLLKPDLAFKSERIIAEQIRIYNSLTQNREIICTIQ